MDTQDKVDSMDVKSKNDTDSDGIVCDTSTSEVIVSEKRFEDEINMSTSDDNLSSKPMVTDISNNTTPNIFQHNIISEDRNELKIINEGSSFEGSLNNINPTPNVEDMVTDDTNDCISTESELKESYESGVSLRTDTEPTNIDDGDSAEPHDHGIVVIQELEKRDNAIVEAMNKDETWKNDSGYQNNLSSLKLLCDYGSDSEEDNNIVEVGVDVNKTADAEAPEILESNEVQVISSTVARQAYRKPESEESESEEEDSGTSDEEESSTSSSSEASSSSSEESDESEESSNECVVIGERKAKTEVPKTKGELGLEDLPPIADLHISVPESQCVEIGEVLSIVDSLVVVKSIKGCPTLDLDSVLFLDHGNKTLGEVFDVFGKVGEACYCVRFNSKDHALERGVDVGMPVYFAPQTEHSKFVFLADLMKMKGSDASWEHNNEPPDKFLDYSDDEEERRASKDRYITREVEVDETQPESKRFNRRGGGMARGRARGRGDRGAFGHRAPHGGFRPQYPADEDYDPPKPVVRGPGPISPWGMPFNPFSRPPPTSTPPPPRPSGPHPLLRPTVFTNQCLPPPPPQQQQQQHYRSQPPPRGPSFHENHPPPTPSPWAVPPPAVMQQTERFATPPPFMQQQQQPPQAQQSRQWLNNSNWGCERFGGSQTLGPPQGAFRGGPCAGNIRASPGSFGNPGVFQQPSPAPPPLSPGGNSFAPQNMGSGSFGNAGPPPMNFSSLRPDMHGAPPSVQHRGGWHRNPNQFGPYGQDLNNRDNNNGSQQGWRG